MAFYLFLDLALLLSEAGLAFRRRASAHVERKDAGSLRLLWIVISVSITAAHVVAQSGMGIRWLQISPLVGVVVFAAGAALRWWSIIHLGRFFTVDVAVARDHQLVETGPYRRVRHPSYTGLLLQFLGIGLSLQNGLSILLVVLPPLAALHFRMNIEERALREQLGSVYTDYCARRRRLFPF